MMPWMAMKHASFGEPSRMQIGWIRPLAGLMAALSLTGAGCSAKPDPNREFAMTLNGAEYHSRLGQPLAYLQEHEAGFSTSLSCTVVFPLQRQGARNRPGLEIMVMPEKVVLGEAMDLTTDAGGYGIHVSYHPASGHQWNKAVMLAYSARRPGGGGTIRFDELDPRPGGRVKGKLIRATLSGYYEDAHSAQITEFREPQKLEVRNFPFDVTLGTFDQLFLSRS
jgi:hypothetical protein